MSRAIRELANDERKKAVLLKTAEHSCEDFQRCMELRKEQNKAFDKFLFLKKLNSALEKK